MAWPQLFLCPIQRAARDKTWGRSPPRGMGEQRGTRWGGQEKGGRGASQYHVLLSGGGPVMVPGTEGTRGWIIPIPATPPIPKPNQRERKAENTGLAPTLQGLFLLGQAGGGVPSPQPPPLPPGLVPEPKGQVEETGALRENPGGENPPTAPTAPHSTPGPAVPAPPAQGREQFTSLCCKTAFVLSPQTPKSIKRT